MKAGCDCNGEQRADAEDVAAHRRCRPALQGHRNDAARLPLEEQQFDGEHHRRDRRREGRRHARRRSRDEQRLAFGGRQMKELRDQRSKRAARHDDRALGAERAARADRDRGRHRLEQRDLRLDAASASSESLRSLRECRARGCVGAVPRHQSDMIAPTTARGSRAGPRWCAAGDDRADAEALEKEKIRKEVDELQQPGGHVCGGHADDDGEPGDRKNPCGGGEIAEVIERVVLDVFYIE